ncbi:MAG: response regulator [Desulfobacterales bacterium]|nr:response regulator [Desulfobacterales bacterium]
MPNEIRLLFADDEVGFLEALSKRLKKRNLSPEICSSGEQCLEILKNKEMDVVVLDIKMPGMSGIDVLLKIKEQYLKTEVILLTGHANSQDGVEGIKSGAFDYLTKPIELEHLISKINQAYDKIVRQEEKKKEAEFKVRLEKQMIATERLVSLGTLASGVAHEINNPLAIINESAGWMKLLLKRKEIAELPIKADFELAIGKIEKGIERAKRITHQLLSFVRKSDSSVSEVNLKDLIEEVNQLTGKSASNKGIDINLKVEPEMSLIVSDPYKIRQVLINLVNNAIQSIDKNGKIIISLVNEPKFVLISIQDTGQGIPKENFNKIFEPFFTTKPPDQGTGLGLFVTKGIVEKLGGKIDLESRLGKGTTFFVRLPKNFEIQKDFDEEIPPDWIKRIKEQF